MATSCVFRSVSRLICFGIALDNGINTLYYLNLENWQLPCIIAITLASVVLNGVLYYQGAAAALENTWLDLKIFSLKSYMPYIISLISAYVMATFTLHNYIEGEIHIPKVFSYLFTLCYFIGTHTLIIQATKAGISNQIINMPIAQRRFFLFWFILFMLATATAIPQWTSGIDWLWHSNALTNTAAWITYIGEACFVAQLALWLSRQKIIGFHKPVFAVIITFSILNALGFACMTEFDSWITNNLSNNVTFTLGFILSFFMMFKSLYIWQANAGLDKPITQLAHHQT